MRAHLAIPAAALLASACVYDGPPEVRLVAPEGGTFVRGDPLRLEFSEPIDPSTLVLRIWPNRRDGEGELASGLEPRLPDCTPGSSCGATRLAVADDARSATLTLDEELGRPDVPLILEVAEGLGDEGGAKTGVASLFDFQFRHTRKANEEPVEFDQGVYVIVAEIADPIPAVLTLITETRVAPDGRAALAGAEGDEINGAPKNTRDPANLIVDAGPEGYAVFTGGFVTLDGGERFLETDPIEMTLVLGPIIVAIHDVRINAKIVRSEETGRDRLDGTLSFSSVTLNPGEDGFDYPAGNAPFSADRVPDELVPAGTPQLCGDLCGAVDGICEPPVDFPPADFCG